jgi:dihydropteroate synthase
VTSDLRCDAPRNPCVAQQRCVSFVAGIVSIVRTPVTVGPASWDWSRTYVCGVVNVTPDSFSDGGRYLERDAAIAHGLRLVEQGADALDVGGESTRPGSTPVDAAEELRRVIPVIEGLARQVRVPISVDTYKAAVAEAAVGAGASLINDVSGLGLDAQLAATAARCGAVLVLGHLRGRPAVMQQRIAFEDVVAEVIAELRQAVHRAVDAGVAPGRIWVDPGIGFGKRAAHSAALVRASGRIGEALGCPVMVGVSRKSFIGEITGLPVEQRLIGTCGAAAAAVLAGADVLRLHDVGELRPALAVADAIRRGLPEPAVRA